MLSSASSAVTDLKDKFNEMANKRKFQTLPDEALATVFEMLYKNHSDDTYRLEFVKSLSLVSRRFRRIVLHLPLMWSIISSTHLHINKAKLFVSRTVTPIISLSLRGAMSWRPTESDKVRVLNYYKLAASISSRIRTMDIYISSSESPYLQQIQQICSDISLPSLLELSLVCDVEVSRDCRDIWRGWNMPSLKKLEVTGILPQLPSDVLSKIHTCSIHLNFAEDIWRTAEVMGFLLSLTTVKDLRVAVRFFEPFARFNNETRMDSVERLTLELQNYKVATGQNILQVIKFPSLISFKLDVGIKDVNDLERALKNVTFLTPPTSVTDVTLAVGMEFENYHPRMPTFMVGEWCNAFEGLECLTLESDRRKTHGLFAFAASVDAIKVTGFETDVDGKYFSDLPDNWGFQPPHRTAVIEAENLGSYKGKIQFIESRYVE